MIINNKKIRSIQIYDSETGEFLHSINDWGTQWKKKNKGNTYPQLNIMLIYEDEKTMGKVTGPESMFDEELLKANNPKELLHQCQW